MEYVAANRRGDKESSSFTIPDIVQMDNKEFWADVVLNFMVAGRDSTAQALSWCIYEIAQRPDVMQKITDEVYKFEDELSDYETVASGFIYIQATILETLRLHPSVPSTGRTARVIRKTEIEKEKNKK